MNEQNELSQLFSQATLNTPIEELSTHLEKTLISTTTRSIPAPSSFSLQTESNNNNNINNNSNNNAFKMPMTTGDLNMQLQQPQQHWKNNSDDNNNKEDDDGWGDAPSYTSLLPYVEFGFTSNIMINQSSPVNNNIPKDSTVNINPNQPFSRFKNTPVTFNSNPN